MSQHKIRNMGGIRRAQRHFPRPSRNISTNPASVRPAPASGSRQALEQYDFRPNIYAVNQNRSLTKNVGIVVPYLADPFFAEIARTLERRCIDAGFSPILYSSHGEMKLETEILEGPPPTIAAMNTGGRLFSRSRPPVGPRRRRALLPERAHPLLFDSNIEDMGEAFVGSDNHSFVQQTVDYSAARRATLLFRDAHPPANPNANKRRNATSGSWKRRGLSPMSSRSRARGLGLRGDRPARRARDPGLGRFATTPVLCSNDRLAIGFLSACYERGLRVGRGDAAALRVASHDDHPFSRFTCPSLTTAAHEYDRWADKFRETLFSLTEAGGRFTTRTES